MPVLPLRAGGDGDLLKNILQALGLTSRQGAPVEVPRPATVPTAVYDDLLNLARTTALSEDDEMLLTLAESLHGSPLTRPQGDDLLVRAWNAAVGAALEDGVLTEAEEDALSRYLDRFDVFRTGGQDHEAMRLKLVKAASIRELTEGIVPKRQTIQGQLPFNLMKSEELVWVFGGVAYLEDVTRREMHGSSRGLTIRVARGIYYRPSTFKSRVVEWDETVRLDTGLMGLTTKHIYFAGDTKRFRVRYDRIVAFEPYSDGIGIMREAQTAKPQTFITNDGWFTYNMATNLAQM